MATAFPDVKPFPGEAAQTAAPIGHNKPPLEETIVAEFVEGLTKVDGLLPRLNQLIERGKGAGPCDSDDLAGRYGDFIKMAGTCAKMIEAEREKHNRPILTAQRALKAKADSYIEPLTDAVNRVRRQLDAYMAEQRRIAAEKQRAAEEEARKAREAAEAAAAEAGAEAAPEIEVTPARVEQPVFRGDYGARVGTRTEWQHEIISVRQLPDRLLKHQKVLEALDKVIAAEVRSGTREIKGVRIWSEQKAAVR